MSSSGFAALLIATSLAASSMLAVARHSQEDGSAEAPVNMLQPPGRLIDIGGGRRLHLLCTGSGSDTVLLEAGLGGISVEWDAVQTALDGKFRVCSYDRGGYGWSDPGAAPRTADRLVDELHTLLDRSGEVAPYVLVGHSFGGYLAQLFAKRYPRLTAGVVLVDSSHPKQFERFPPAYRRTYELANGRSRLNTQSLQVPEGIAPRWHAVAKASARQPKTLRAIRLELRSFVRSGAQVSAAGVMPSAVPVVVLTRGKRQWPPGPDGDAMENLWPALQRELAEGMPQAHHFTIAGSGHHIHLDTPDAVADAIRFVEGEAACSGTGVAGTPAPKAPGSC